MRTQEQIIVEARVDFLVEWLTTVVSEVVFWGLCGLVFVAVMSLFNVGTAV